MNMNKIKFSHNYPKLWTQKTAKLLAVFEIEDINEDLKEYDTVWDENGDLGYYPLPEGKKIQLIFIGNKSIPFCTIRRHTKEKLSYYYRKIGEEFEISINLEGTDLKEGKK